ncbi:MAG: V-type ATP synthase subunit F [Ruminococcus sp.]|nr:V-type ATP synthase subunit F [Ruminococcus sp.]
MPDRIAAVGDKESVYGFAALGLDTYFTDPREDSTATFKKLCQSGNYSIIYVTEAAAVALEKEIEKYRSEPSPAIILIPGVSGNTGEGLSAVRVSVEKAVGSDIFNE